MAQLRDLYRFDHHIRNIAHHMRYINDRKLAEYSITNPQARLLLAIREGMESPDRGVNRRYLEEATGLKGPSVTGLLNGLEKNGFVERASSVRDARATAVTVTAKGARLLDEMQRFFVETESILLDGMTPLETEAFLRLLEKAAANLSAAIE